MFSQNYNIRHQQMHQDTSKGVFPHKLNTCKWEKKIRDVKFRFPTPSLFHSGLDPEENFT